MAKDWTKIYEEHKGEWVALGEDEMTVIAFGSTAKETFEKAQALGYKNPILTRVPEQLVAYVGLGL